jgi:beta-mannosidase
MHTQFLNGEWRLRKSTEDKYFPARVPGCVHVDLMDAGVIPDPFEGVNEQKVAWVAETDWTYRRAFVPDEALTSHERVFLECDGLDTLATIRLNGEEIARTDNMHRRYRFDVTGSIRPGENTLDVEFTSPVNHVCQVIDEYPHVKQTQYSIHGSPCIRKAAYQWGWDWAPQIPTSGIWRSIRLVGCTSARLDDIRVRQQHGQDGVLLDIAVSINRFSQNAFKVQATLTSPDGKMVEHITDIPGGASAGSLQLSVENPELWWPNGYGGQPLYELKLDLKSAQDTIGSRIMRIGLRTLELRQEEDEWGRSFVFTVNGVTVFCKGADWVPADHFPARMTDDRYTDLISSAAASHMNMLRVWGGGIYEDDLFYDLCDKYGILIWQDFMFACAHYPATDEMLQNIKSEAVDNIRRIRHHPCLALWCGNNEMEWALVDWEGWGSEARKAEHSEIFYRLLPEVCAIEDSCTPYHPSSPSSRMPYEQPNGEEAGDGHYWDVWHGRKPFAAYREQHHRFMSEFGFQSLPCMDTVKAFSQPKDWNITSHIIEAHQKNDGGTELILYYMAQTFRIPKDFPTTIYISQILQAEAMRCGVEHWRRNRNNNRCMGTLYWQYNDCWPVASWAGIDYGHRWKALQYYAKRFYAPVLISAEENSAAVKLHITNDRLTPFQGEVRWSLERLDGKVIEDCAVCVNAPAASSICVSELDFSGLLDEDARRDTVLIYMLREDNRRIGMGMVSFMPCKHMELREPYVSAEVEEVEDEIHVVVASDVTARYVMLDVPGCDVRFSDNYFDLPPGRLFTIKVERTGGLSAQEIAEKLKVISLRDSYT